jgi:hypothetical protein
MDADETLSRLFRQRRYLPVLAILIGFAIILIVQHQSAPTYRADARLVLGPELNSSQEAQTVVSRARAIATSNKVLTTAIQSAKVPRTVGKVAGEVSLSGISDSGIARLSVTDADPAIAAALCRALGTATTAFINTTNSEPVQSTLASIDSQLQQALSDYKQTQSQVGGSVAAVAQLAAINENINALSTARGQLLARHAQAVPAAVVDQPPALGVRTSSNFGTVVGLAATSAVLIWLLAAAVMESFRPTLPTLRSVGRHFDAPVLGKVRDDLAPDDAQTSEAIDRLVLSAQHLRAGTLVVAGERASAEFVSRLDSLLKEKASIADHSTFSETVDYVGETASPLPVRARGAVALGTKAEEGIAVPASRNGRATKVATPPRRALPFELGHLAPSRGTGVVVVANSGVRRSKLGAIEELVRCSYWPVVGVIQVDKSAHGPRA